MRRVRALRVRGEKARPRAAGGVAIAAADERLDAQHLRLLLEGAARTRFLQTLKGMLENPLAMVW